jgi:energy-coupling factor transport system substrate-specific component
MKKNRIFLALILAVGIAAFIIPAFDSLLLNSVLNWGVIIAILASLTIAAFFFEFEMAAVSSKEIALIAMLGTISAVSRVPFAAIPNVQPSTYLIICAGYVFGPVAGFAVGAITALVSNFFLGQGPWTLYQMIAWGLAGVSAGYLSRFNMNRGLLVAFGILWGYLYGWITNLWFWTAFIYPLTLNTFILTQINTVWFDTLHAIGNAIFMGILGMKTIAILERFKRRFTVKYLTI